MAKGYLLHSKIRSSMRRKGARRRIGKRLLAQRPRQTFYTPLTRFCPLPTDLRLSFRLNWDDIVGISSTGLSRVLTQQLSLPYQATSADATSAPRYAGGLLPFFWMYSRILVKKAVARVRFVSMSSNQQTPAFINTMVINNSDALSLASVSTIPNSYPYALSTLPQSHTFTLSRGDGGVSQFIDTQAVDVSRYLGQLVDVDYALVRDPVADAGSAFSITCPSAQVLSRAPTWVAVINNSNTSSGGDITSYHVFYDIEYHVELSGLYHLPVEKGEMASRTMTMTQRGSS